MTEQKIEKIVVDKMSNALSAAGITDVQVMGAWQPDDYVKGLEDESLAGALAVKVLPRQYETPTIPDGQMQVDLALTMRAEVDSTGTSWLSASEVISGVLQAWQKAYASYRTDFNIEGEFMPTGFNIAGGDCGLDKQTDVWIYTQSFNLYGIIN